MRLSVLDQSPIRSGGTAAQAIQETLALAEAADRLGYHRYWLAEHHATPSLAGSAPEILIGQVASRTRGIRVGSGGVMLSHYSPLKVAETFRMLELLFPGRIDLGVGRAPGSDTRTARALAPASRLSLLEEYPDKVELLLGFLHDALPRTHPFADIQAVPEVKGAPPVWLLGSGGESADLAARLGTAFAFAQFIAGRGAEAALQSYARAFRPSAWLPAPCASLAVFVICAATAAEAERLARSRDLFLLRLQAGQLRPYPTVEEAEAYPYSSVEREIVQQNRQRVIAGDPGQVRERLEGLAEACGVEELLLLTITHDARARFRSYELLAEACGLPPRLPTP
jgi:luciferase family oxidoreductase group 1